MTFAQKKPIKTVLPGVYLICALIIDRHVNIGLSTPFCVVIGMMYMAVNYHPKHMIPWCVIYTLTVCCIFMLPSIYVYFSHQPYDKQYVAPHLRSATYIVVGILSAYLCRTVNRSKKAQQELQEILMKIPWPVVTSDSNGKFSYSNKSAQNLFPELKESYYLNNYFDLLAPQKFQGRTIAEYMQLFDRELQNKPLELAIRGTPYLGHTQLLESSGTKLLLTILVKNDSP